ncbi:hypothetical protein BHM03_00051770, partial [Ensete ventricosum]
KAIGVGRYRAPFSPSPNPTPKPRFFDPPPPSFLLRSHRRRIKSPPPPPQTLTNPSSRPSPISQIEERSHLFSRSKSEQSSFPVPFLL